MALWLMRRSNDGTLVRTANRDQVEAMQRDGWAVAGYSSTGAYYDSQRGTIITDPALASGPFGILSPPPGLPPPVLSVPPLPVPPVIPPSTRDNIMATAVFFPIIVLGALLFWRKR